ncbi:MAG: DUF2490 domain-containing protein [Bacteroidota bacterium]|nr:DUF2490 domain-containing protein [Bacteroidota bacterium]
MRRVSIVFLFFLMLPSFAFSQVVVRDFEGWAGVKVRKKLGDNWTLSLEEHLRMEHNMSQLDEFFTEFNAGYDILQDVNLALGIRGVRHKTGSGDLESRMRFHFETEYSHDINRTDLSFRLRYQSRFDTDEEQLLNALRFKTGMRWNPSNFPIDPYSSLEGFFKMPGRSSTGHPGVRLAIGGIWKINKTHHIRLFYHLEWNNEEYYSLWINRLGMRYDLRL